MKVNLAKIAKISLLLDENITILAKYQSFLGLFSKKLVEIFFKHLRSQKFVIDRKKKEAIL